MTPSRNGHPKILLALARGAILWERLWPRLWTVVSLIGLFAAIALLDILPMLPSFVHLAVLILFVLVAVFFLHRMLRPRLTAGLSIGLAQARHRVERDSGLAHRPLTSMGDSIASGADDPVAVGLWRAHQQRMRQAARRLSVKLPSPGLARFDPYGLRAAVLLVLVIGLAAGRGDAAARFERALIPGFGLAVDEAVTLGVWITPPVYTGLPPVFLEPARAKAQTVAAESGEPIPEKPVVVPLGSAVLAQANGLKASPTLRLGETVLEFLPIGDGTRAGAHRLETVIGTVTSKATGDAAPQAAAQKYTPGDANPDAAKTQVTKAGKPAPTPLEMSVEADGRKLAHWRLSVLADQPPEIYFTQPPKNAGRAQLRFDYESVDDYGVASVEGIIRLPQSEAPEAPEATAETDDKADTKPATRADKTRDEIRLALPGPLRSRATAGKAQRLASTRDLSAHPWAGVPVEVHLEATDGLGQKGESGVVTMVLPERTFNHPVARAIVHERKKLVNPTDTVREDVVGALADIAARPQYFLHDISVYLALRLTMNRLYSADWQGDIASVQKLLWDAALDIEEGELSLAERELRNAQQRLNEGLSNDADAKEIDRLMSELKTAMNRFFAALSEKLKQEGRTMEQLIDPNSEIMTSDDLQRMIDEARELARSGAKDAARQMLSRLQNMLDNLRAGMRSSPSNTKARQANRLMKGLRSLTNRQKRLLDQTFRRLQQQGRNGNLGKDGTSRDNKDGTSRDNKDGTSQDNKDGKFREGKNDAAAQEALRRALGKMMLDMDRMLGGIPKNMGEAERAMRGAVGSLGKGHDGEASEQQSRALDSLRQAGRNIAQQLSRQMGVGRGVMNMPSGTRAGDRNDPFSRPPGGAQGSLSDGTVKIPTKMQRLRSREILDELRRRSGDRKRPVPERDYIERLIEPF